MELRISPKSGRDEKRQTEADAGLTHKGFELRIQSNGSNVPQTLAMVLKQTKKLANSEHATFIGTKPTERKTEIQDNVE